MRRVLLACLLTLAMLAASATAKPPHGAVRPAAGSVRTVGGTTCVDGEPGRMIAHGRFLSDRQQVLNLTRRARRAHGRHRRALRRQAARFGAAYAAGKQACATPAAPVPTPTPAPSVWYAPTPTVQATTTPLRFDVRHAAGLALAPVSGARRAGTGGSNLLALSATGTTTDAVTSGQANISQFLIAPDGSLYILFSVRVDLDDTSRYSPTGCLLAHVDPATGVPTCIDSTLVSVAWAYDVGLNPPIQFDAGGAVYYRGQTTDGHFVLRRWSNGTSTDLITDAINLRESVVTKDGSVLITGQTSTGASWVRRIRPDGSLQGLLPYRAEWMYPFPDGNVYMGLESAPVYGVGRYVQASGAMDPKGFYGEGFADGTTVDQHQVCTANSTPAMTAFCGSFGVSVKQFFTFGSKVLALTGNGALVQYHPSVAYPATAVDSIQVAEPIGNDLLLSGTNAANRNLTTLLDTLDGRERQLIGPDKEVEIYHAGLTGSDEVLFDGLRFADNTYVLGTINLQTGAVTTAPAGTGRVTAFQTF